MSIRLLVISLMMLFLGCAQEQKDIFGKIIQDTAYYDLNLKVVQNKDNQAIYLKSGIRVMLSKTKDKCRTGKYDEPVDYVMLPNKYGDFVYGEEVCIPSSKIKWDN